MKAVFSRQLIIGKHYIFIYPSGRMGVIKYTFSGFYNGREIHMNMNMKQSDNTIQLTIFEYCNSYRSWGLISSPFKFGR